MSVSYKTPNGQVEDFIMANPPLTLVDRFLQEQPESYEAYFTKEEMIELVKNGKLIAWVLVQNGEPQGMTLFQVHEYGKGRTALKIEFVSCKNFFAMNKLWDHLKVAAEQAGILFIEALAHDTIAEYAMRKKGFTSPSRYLVRAVNSGTEN